MADKDAQEPSLELPSLGFRRKRRKQDTTAESAPVRDESAPASAESAPVRDEPAPVRTEPAPAPPEAAPAPDEPAPPRAESAPAPSIPAPTVPEPTPGRRAEPVSTPASAPQLVADDVDETREQPIASEGGSTGTSARRFSLPALGGLPASVVTGALVGILTVGLTWAGFRLCELVQGTSSCGDPGFLLLLAIMVAMALLGASLLRAWSVADAGSTSVLAVGLMAVIALLFLVDVLFSWWMILVIPAVAMATFALAHWVTTIVAEPHDR